MRHGPVIPTTLDVLLDAVRACATGPLRPDPEHLVDREAFAANARRFKVDVSFALLGDGSGGARFSINDKGEPEAFRARLTEQASALGLRPETLAEFFAIAAPGEVQTTLGVKWPASGGEPERLSLYYEELCQSPRAEEIVDGMARLGGLSATPRDESPLPAGSACVDFANSVAVAFKDYRSVVEQDPAAAVQLPANLERYRRALPRDRKLGTRRYLWARRFDPGGVLRGHKILWLSEAQEPLLAERAWKLVDRLRRELHLPPSRPAEALEQLRAQSLPEDTYLYPDLVSLDTDADDTPRGLVIYVSVK